MKSIYYTTVNHILIEYRSSQTSAYSHVHTYIVSHVCEHEEVLSAIVFVVVLFLFFNCEDLALEQGTAPKGGCDSEGSLLWNGPSLGGLKPMQGTHTS